MALKNNTWKLNQWYDQNVAGNVSYTGENKLMAWGENYYGNLGQNNTTKYSSPVQIPGTNWSLTYANQEGSTIATKTDGTLWFWGYNDDGTSGQNTNPFTKLSSPVQIPGSIWSKPATAINYCACSRTDGSLWMWGGNSQGELGQNNKTIYSSPRQIPGTTWDQPFASNLRFGGCTKTNGELWMWGYGYWGYLGNNTNDTGAHKSSPIQIPGTTWTGNIVTALDCTIAIKTDGTLWAWGKNGSGQMGQNEPANKHKSSPTQIGSGTDWSQVAGGPRTCLAIKTDGTLWSWGYGSYGQTGQNNRTAYSSPIQIPGTNWSHVEAGKSIYATKTDGTLWAWGENDDGNLAQNNRTNYSSPVQIGTDTGWSLENNRNTTGKHALATFVL